MQTLLMECVPGLLTLGTCQLAHGRHVWRCCLQARLHVVYGALARVLRAFERGVLRESGGCC